MGWIPYIDWMDGWIDGLPLKSPLQNDSLPPSHSARGRAWLAWEETFDTWDGTHPVLSSKEISAIPTRRTRGERPDLGGKTHRFKPPSPSTPLNCVGRLEGLATSRSAGDESFLLSQFQAPVPSHAWHDGVKSGEAVVVRADGWNRHQRHQRIIWFTAPILIAEGSFFFLSQLARLGPRNLPHMSSGKLAVPTSHW